VEIANFAVDVSFDFQTIYSILKNHHPLQQTNAETKPATQTGLFGPQISALIRTFSCFFKQENNL